jgi:thiol peroxidase
VSKTAGKRTILDIFPTIATGVCQAGVKAFAGLAPGLENTEIIAVSQDLPLAVANYCGAEGIEGLIVGSAFRSGFGTDYGITMADGNWRGLLARSVVVIDTDGTVLHTQLTPAIGTEPDYEAAVAVLR